MSEELFRVASVRDPAIDTGEMTLDDVVEYAEKHRDIDKLKVKPGSKLAVFRIREIPHHMWGGFFSPNDTPEDHMKAFRTCVMEVENLPRKDGAFIEGVTECKRVEGMEVMDSRTLARFEPLTMFEIGAIAYRRSLFQNATETPFPLPLFCREVLALRMSRPAASSPSSQPPSSD